MTLALGLAVSLQWLLDGYLTPQGRVNYAELKANGKGQLDKYVASLAAKWPVDIKPGARKAELINAYNALTISWIVSNYPVASIWRTKKPFRAQRHTVDGRKVSLDDIETELRNTGDPRIHAALVCASRGCPPLSCEAYTEGRLDSQLDAITHRWLAMPELNEFLPAQNLARVSKIFDWYKADFDKQAGGVIAFLARYAPTAPKFPTARTSVRHKAYDWGLNDTSALGDNYSHINFLWDAARNR